MKLKNWTVDLSVHYPRNCLSSVKKWAEAIAERLKIPCIAREKWIALCPLRLKLSVRLPGDELIESYYEFSENDYRLRDRYYLEHSRDILFGEIFDHIRKELFINLGWTDE